MPKLVRVFEIFDRAEDAVASSKRAATDFVRAGLLISQLMEGVKIRVLALSEQLGTDSFPSSD
jgi:hypothetical protein